MSKSQLIHSCMQSGELVDMYARGDITSLARANSYARLQWEDLTVGQALGLAAPHQPPWPPQPPTPTSSVSAELVYIWSCAQDAASPLGPDAAPRPSVSRCTG